MKTLRVLSLVLLATFGLSVSSQAAANWETNYPAALAQAAKENKMVLLNFTGSDWCPWCVKLDRDTFSKPAFQKYAEQNLILVELDFPQNKPQSAALQRQNLALQEKYGTMYFPTLILLNSKGQEIARNEGDLPGGPAGFIKWAQSFRH